MGLPDSKEKEYIKEYNKKYYEKNRLKRIEYYENKKVLCAFCKNYYYGGYYIEKHYKTKLHIRKREEEEKL